MKKTVPAILRNEFRGKAHLFGTFGRTPHGNGGGPISSKENRQSCSYYNSFWLEAQQPAGLLSVSCLSYNKGSNWLTI